MATKKITLNELRTLVKQIIKEENEKQFANIEDFANFHNLGIKEVNYKSQGVNLERKGYDLVDANGNIQLSIEPKSYGKDSIYSKDKWYVKNYAQNDSFYIDRISNIPKKLTDFKPLEFTGYKFK